MSYQCQVNAVASGFLPISEKMVLMESYRKIFSDLGIQLVTDMGSPDIPLLYFVCTGGTEQEILRLQKQRGDESDILLIAHPYGNSLPAALEVLARFQQLGKTGKIVYFRSPEDFSAVDQLQEIIHFFNVDKRLASRKIGLVGQASDWLVASSHSCEMIRSFWGPKTMQISLQDLIDEVSKRQKEAIEVSESISESGGFDMFSTSELLAITDLTIEPKPRETEDAVEILNQLKMLIEKHDLDAVSLQCFDLITELKTTGCYALAMLNDEGIIAGCEGDMVSTLTMLLVKELLSETSWMANPAQINIKTNNLWLAHCTVPCKMIGDYRIRSHFESGLGVAIEGQMRMQPVTLLRIGGKDLDQYWVAEGEIIQTGSAENLCRTQACIEISRGHVSDLLEKPLGNHLILFYGQKMDMIQRYMAHRKLRKI